MRRPILLLALPAAACVPQPKPAPPVAAPAPIPTPAPTPPPLAADWRDWPQTSGDWRYRRDAQGSTATFGTMGSAALATLRCDMARRTVSLSVPGTVPASLTLRTTSISRTLPAAPSPDPAAGLVAASLSPNDPLLDAIGFSRGRFVVNRPGAPPLVLPAWAEVERVTQDCRGG